MAHDPTLSFSVNTPDENVPAGSDVTFIITVTNNDTVAKDIVMKWTLDHEPFQALDTITVAPGDTETYPFTVTDIEQNRRFWVSFYTSTGIYLGRASESIFVYRPTVEVDLSSDKDIYSPGDTIIISLSLENKLHNPIETTTDLRVLDPGNAQVYYTQSIQNLCGYCSSTQMFNYLLPTGSETGVYLMRAETFSSTGEKIGSSTALFRVPWRSITIEIVPPVNGFEFGTTNTLSLTLTDASGFGLASGQLSITVRDPDQIEIFNGTDVFNLPAGGNATVSFLVDFPQAKSGVFSIAYQLSTGTEDIAGTLNLPATIFTKVVFTKNYYPVRLR
ncbi:hypothetical protein ACFL27_01900 [candidate division CSSED10-310 bacterium]|uniref:Alpha-2-macroglobulin domain-containing protein n=1 Tax=candidate division CSSED10-310 bacterium TaxID=2855610 RepID=A0ABV6YRW1_UNCC1